MYCLTYPSTAEILLALARGANAYIGLTPAGPLLIRLGRNPDGLVLFGGGAGAFDSASCLGAGLGASPHVRSCWNVGISRPVTRVYRAPIGPPRSSQESVFVDTPSRNAFA